MSINLLSKAESKDGSIKFLWRLSGGHAVESIYFPMKDGFIYCLSSQVGCNVGCPFCETGKQKSKHNLSPDEILGQVYGLLNEIKKTSVDEIDFAGMGEPLHNFSSVSQAATRMKQEKLTKLVSLTTAGVVPTLTRLPQSDIEELYVSLHASNNLVRNKIVPINKKWPIGRLIQTAEKVSKAMGKKVTMNYLLFKNLNDSLLDAKNLETILNPALFRVQLSEWNHISSAEFQRAPSSRVDFFYDHLTHIGFEVFKMRSKGSDINGGCGQLNSSHQESKENKGKL